jgi:hypothetical protein
MPEKIITVIIQKRFVGEHKRTQQALYEITIFNEQEEHDFIANLYRARNSLIDSRT